MFLFVLFGRVNTESVKSHKFKLEMSVAWNVLESPGIESYFSLNFFFSDSYKKVI